MEGYWSLCRESPRKFDGAITAIKGVPSAMEEPMETNKLL